MAYPIVEDLLTQGFSTPAGLHLVDMPSAVTDGNLLLLLIAADGADASSIVPSGWTEVVSLLVPGAILLGYAKVGEVADGGTSVTVDRTNTGTAAAHVLHISGWGGTITTDIDVSAGSTGSGTSPDPDAVTSGWGSDTNLFMALAVGLNDDATASAYPANYIDNNSHIVSGAGVDAGIELSLATRDFTSVSDDPGVFTWSQSESWSALTMVIKPSAGGGSITGTASLASLSANVSGSGQMVNATVTVTVAGATSLSGLSYFVFTGTGVGTEVLLKQGLNETTDASNVLEIDLTGTGVLNNDELTILITDFTAGPTAGSFGAICYASAVVV